MASSQINKHLLWPLIVGFASGVAGLYLMIFSHANLLALGMIIICLLSFLKINHTINQTERDVTSFLESIEYEDFSRRFVHDNKSGQTQRLAQAFDKVLVRFGQLRLQHEQQTQLLQMIIGQLNSGIILLNNKRQITIRNNAALHQLNIQGLKTADQITEKYPQLTALFAAEQNNTLVIINDHQFQLNTHNIRVGNQSYQLIVLNNIHQELESTEIESWQKLIRVLIHEISNSITPISSLAATTEDMITLSVLPQLHDQLHGNNDLIETMDDIHQSVSTISRRSEGLVSFVEEYRKLTHIKEVDKQPVLVSELIGQIQSLLSDELNQQQVDLSIEVEPQTLSVAVDLHLIEQVLINIFINALQATQNLQTSAKIAVHAYINDYAKAVIDISDNGEGMTQDAQAKIFIPFYTTKPKGSGVGLALARQIMHKHNGAIQVSSQLDKGSRFRLIF